LSRLAKKQETLPAMAVVVRLAYKMPAPASAQQLSMHPLCVPFHKQKTISLIYGTRTHHPKGNY